MRLPLLSLLLAATLLGGCYVHSIEGTIPASNCQTSSSSVGPLTASNTNCGNAIASPTPTP
ncbi:MAG: hypothetical protein ACREQI_01870 [Candidatus Binataceae bacterium]